MASARSRFCVHHVPVQVVEERLDVLGARAAVVDPVRVLVDVQRQDRRGVPQRERVLRVADHGGQHVPVVVVGEPHPAARREARGLEVGEPRVVRGEVALDQLEQLAARRAALAAEVPEVDLVVLDAADRERQVDAQRAQVAVDLVGGGAVDACRASPGSRSSCRCSPCRARSALPSCAPRCRSARGSRRTSSR